MDFILSLSAFLMIESRIIKSGQRAPLLDLSIFKIARFTLPGISMILFFVASFMVGSLGTLLNGVDLQSR